MAEDEKEYPVWCVAPHCGIDDCGDCPFSPWNLRQKQKELEKKYRYLDTNRHLNKRMDGWVSQIIKYKKEIDDKYHDQNQELSELKERVEGIYKSIHGIAPDDADIIKEVLREFIIRMEGLGGYDFSYFKKKLNGGEKTVVPEGWASPDKEASLDKSLNNSLPADSKPQFICNKCGSKVYLPGVGKLKGKYMCANCNNWQEKEKPPKTWADYGFKKDHQEVTDITEKPPEQDAGSARQTDAFDALWYAVEPQLLKARIQRVLPNHIIVEKADLEFLVEIANRMNNVEKVRNDQELTIEEFGRLVDLQQKYLKEEAEKKE